MSDPQSLAESVGMVLGMILGVILVLGVPTLFIVSLVLAIRKRKRLWAALAGLSGILCLVLVVGLFGYGLYRGISQSRSAVAGEPAAATEEAFASRELTSDDGLCALTIPSHWGPLDNLNEQASLQVGHLRREEYLIVLTDLLEDFAGTLAQHAQLTSDGLLSSLEGGERSAAETLEINGYPAIRYEITGTTELVNIVYFQTTFEGSRGFHQVLGWTIASKEEVARGVIREVTSTFRELDPAPGADPG